MGDIAWERWAPVSGIVSVLLWVVGIIVIATGDFDIGETDEEILAYYADSGNRAGEIAAFFLFTLGVLFFLWFLSTLRNRLRSAESEPRSLSALAFGAGVASAALLIGAFALGVGISFTVEESGEFVVDPNLARVAENTSYLLLVGAIMVGSVVVAATSVLALRTSVLPSSLGWVGLFVAVVLLFAIFFVPMFVLWLWILVVSVVLILRRHVDQPTEQDVPAPR